MTTPDSIDDLASALGVLLLRSNRSFLYHHLTQDIDELDETLYPVLSGLARLGAATPTDLAGEIGLDRSVTTRYAARLERSRLIRRGVHPTDGRATLLELTATGQRAIARSRDALRGVIAAATSSWSEDRVASVSEGLIDLVASFQDFAGDANLADDGVSAKRPQDR